MTPRFQPIADPELSDDQRRLAEEVGARSGPYFAYQRSPGLWRAMQAPRAYFRSQTNLGRAEQELAIIVTARHWKSGFAFSSHAALAREAGLAEDVIQAVANDAPPALPPAQAAIHDFCRALVRDGQVDDAAFNAVKTHFGEPGVVDLVGLVGYYSTVSLLLNVDRQQAQEPLPF